MQTKGIPTELGTESIGKLLATYAIPAIIAQTAASLYNTIDGIFIGQGVGTLAISGLATTFPFMNLSAAFGAMVGIGGATQLSVKLGQRDYDSAKLILGNLITLNIIIGVVFAAISLLFLKPILSFFGASEATLPYASEYMEVILYGNVVTHLYFGINAALRASGHPKESMYATILTVIINIILTPIFIYHLDWGIRGAAIATIVSQVITLIWQTRLLSRPGEFLHLQKGIYSLRKKMVKGILSIGMSPFLMNATACVIIIIINKGLRTYSIDGDLAIASYGIVNRIIFMFIMVVMGLNQGMQPIVGYNYGANKIDRVEKALKLTIVTAIGIMSIGFILCEAFPEIVARAFTKDETLIALSAKAMRIVASFLMLVGVQMVTTNFFQSIGMVGKSIFLSLTRQMLFLIPFLIFFPLIWGEAGVWLSMPAADFLAFIVSIILLNVQFKKWKHSKS